MLHHAACRGSTIWRLICVPHAEPIADFTLLKCWPYSRYHGFPHRGLQDLYAIKHLPWTNIIILKRNVLIIAYHVMRYPVLMYFFTLLLYTPRWSSAGVFPVFWFFLSSWEIALKLIQPLALRDWVWYLYPVWKRDLILYCKIDAYSLSVLLILSEQTLSRRGLSPP